MWATTQEEEVLAARERKFASCSHGLAILNSEGRMEGPGMAERPEGRLQKFDRVEV